MFSITFQQLNIPSLAYGNGIALDGVYKKNLNSSNF